MPRPPVKLFISMSEGDFNVCCVNTSLKRVGVIKAKDCICSAPTSMFPDDEPPKYVVYEAKLLPIPPKSPKKTPRTAR